MTVGNTTIATNDRSTLPSLHLSESTHNRLIKGQCEQLPPLASPLVLAKRNIPIKEPLSVRAAKKVIFHCIIHNITYISNTSIRRYSLGIGNYSFFFLQIAFVSFIHHHHHFGLERNGWLINDIG